MWLLLVLASALLPGRAECSAGAGAPRWSHQKKRQVSGQRQRSRESVCPHRLRGSDRARHRAVIPEGNPAGHLHAPAWLGDVTEILVQSEYTYWSHLCHLHRQHRETAAPGEAGPVLYPEQLRALGIPGDWGASGQERCGHAPLWDSKGIFPLT